MEVTVLLIRSCTVCCLSGVRAYVCWLRRWTYVQEKYRYGERFNVCVCVCVFAKRDNE